MSKLVAYIHTPNLPKTKIRCALVDFRTSRKIIDSLKKLGIKPIFSCKANSLYDAVCGHPDMLLHHLGDKVFACTSECYRYFEKLLPDCKLIQGTGFLRSNYPFDIAYNVARINNLAFHNLKYTEKVISEYYEKVGVKLINVKQGYAKCNVCIVQDKAIITSDKSIAKRADDYNLDVLMIREGYIELKDFPYGFIGGASGLISPNCLVFAGDIKNHPDYERILEFCHKYYVQIYSLSDEKLTDIGSIIPVF
ncbi:MAG: hypothetical protein N2171_00515 [Clostridia bacterium]|nr:hypothetical protein [Clostridia bacterium]